ncbi:PD-(D/E)XK nuclease family protein, partial [Rubripirellula amarantea]|nr:PD-(D/E)XK nuclease family protein [Rubripirellula amarantea]
LPLDDEHLVPADDISDQAVAVAQSLDEQIKVVGHRESGQRVVIGVTDETHVGPVEMELRGSGHHTFRGLGWTVASTSIGRLFDLTSAHLQLRTWRTLAALVRHSHVAHQITQSLELENSAKWIENLDGLLANHYPTRIDGELPAVAISRHSVAIEVAKWVDQWLQPFWGGLGKTSAGKKSASRKSATKTIGGWCSTIADWLDSVPSPLPEHQSHRTSMATHAAKTLLQRFASLNSDLDLTVTGGIAMEMMSVRLADLRVVGTPDANDIEIIGWLDLALDDADAMTVIGFNHPFVPSAVTSDPFLPGSLRTMLRMADNDRRFARDIYAAQLVLSTRRHTRFIVGKNGADGSPTPPSRLIAAAPKPDIARRVRNLLEGKRELAQVVHSWDKGPDVTHLPIPKFDLSKERKSASDPIVKVMSVTAFRDYLTCPYRFYIRHVLKYIPLDDEGRELAANQFGDLVHGALEDFGNSPYKGESSVSKIEAALLEYLHAYADRYYGGDTSMAVTLQVTQAERRLKAVAIEQAQRIEQGWTIHATEASVSESAGACITVPEGKMGIRGRFDRIDFHAQTGRWAILDYKTHGHSPEKKHFKKIDGVPTWIDLQLPLYRMMIPYLDLGKDASPDNVELGYFNVSEKDEETKINLATFTPDQLDEADEIICRCVSGVLREEFEPTDQHVDFDDYSMILQTGIADRMLDRDEVWGQGE